MTGAVPTPPAYAKSITILQLLADLLRHRRMVIGLPFLVGIIAAGVSLLIPTRYTASVSFTPETESLQSGFGGGLAGGLAGQLLAGIPNGDGPRFYAEILMSRTLLEGVLRSPSGESGADSTMLTTLFAIRGQTYEDSLAYGVRKLSRFVHTTVDIPSNIVTVNAEARSPERAARVANRLVALLNEFNSNRRQSRARQRRIFVEERLKTSADELLQAEEATRAFLEQNRSIQSSPQLQFDLQALQRVVNAAEQVYLTLLRELEQARVDEANDVPVITVVDPAIPPLRKSSPRRVLIVLGSSGVAFLATVMMAFSIDYVRDAQRQNSPDLHDLQSTWDEARSRWRRGGLGPRSKTS